MSYTSLHNHTSSSNERLIDSINKPNKLIQRAFDIGLNGIAITDHETVNAHVKCKNYVEKMKQKDEKWQDFKLILGNEIYLCRNNLSKDNFISGQDKFYHFILLAKDVEGHHQIRQLSTRAYEHSWMRNGMRRVPTYYSDIEEIVGNNQGHIIASTACIGGYLGSRLLQYSVFEQTEPQAFEDNLSTLTEWLTYIQNIFGKDNFYLEMQPSNNHEQKYVNKWIKFFSEKLNIPVIITTDSHYYSAEDRGTHKAFLNSKEGDREVDDFYASAYLMAPDEIHSYMDDDFGADYINMCFENTNTIANSIENYDLKRPFKLPYLPSEEDKKLANNRNFAMPNDVNFDLDIWNYFINSDEPADRVFLHRIINKCNTDPQRFWRKASLDEIEIELKTVRDASIKQQMVWSRYFLQVADYIQIMWNEGDSLVAPGRGSGVGFYINYLLDITQIDPLAEKVPLRFWRFLNPERASVLDIDSDIQSNRRNNIIQAMQKKYGEKRVVRVLTKKTEGARSAILTAARSVGVDVDTAKYLASFVVADRGAQRSLSDIYYGNEEKGFEPNKTFIEEMNKYPELWNIATSIEGLETSCSSHAGGVIIVDEDFTNTSSMMKLNSGDWVSCWDLHESEDSAGQVKIDLLATEALTYIRTCLDLLVNAGLTPKMPTLRETYEKCIGIYNLNRDDTEMWRKLGNGELLNIFQMDTPQGKQGIALVKPTNVEELTALNSVMRLTSESNETPMQKYTRFKQNNDAWDNEMINAGLTEEERKMLHSYLDVDHGLAVSQEEMMILLLEPMIAGWPLAMVDKCRKSIAKKNAKLYEEISEEFFKNAEEKGLSKNLTNYVWNILIAPQKTYSFCSAHGLAYSLVGLQEMNLACMHPTIFWNTANIIVDSAGADGISDDDDEEDGENETEEVKRAKKTMDYGRTAAAIGKFQSKGIKILPPNINSSSFTFTPNVETNSITYGLRGITRLSSEIIKDIIDNRPYTSIADLLNKVKLTKIQMINLIKSGAIDELENKPREEILYDYIKSTCDTKKRITMQNMAALLNYNLLPREVEIGKCIYNFNKFLSKNKEGKFYKLNDEAIDFIDKFFSCDIIIEGDKLDTKVWDKEYKSHEDFKKLQDYVKSNSNDLLEKLNNAIVSEEFEKYASGNISKWEMESVSFYSHSHELENIKINHSDFSKLPIDPIVIDVNYWKGKEFKKYATTNIVGTVIDKDKNHETITLLTTDGVVIVKLYNDIFVNYDKQISKKNPDGTKTVIEKSWFERGSLLIVHGMRRGANFAARKPKNGNIITKITKVYDDGTIEIKNERESEIQ